MDGFDMKGRLGLDGSAFERTLQRQKKTVRGFVGATVKQFGALAGVAGMGGLATSAINLGSKISDMAVQLNIGAEELQVLEFAAREAGVETGIMERAIRNVQLRTQQGVEGNKRYAEAYDTLGISMEEVNALPVEKKLEAIAKAQAGATDQQAAYNAVAAILGERAGPKMQEILQTLATDGFANMANAAKASGTIMDEEVIAKMDKAADKIEQFKRVTVVAMADVLSSFQSAADGIGEFIGRVAFMGGMSDDEFEAKLQLQSEGALENTGGRGGVKRANKLIEERAKLISKERVEQMKAANATKEAEAAKRAEIEKTKAAQERAHKSKQELLKNSKKQSTSENGPMGLNIERGEFESRKAFLNRREEARVAFAKLNEAKRQIGAGSERFDPAELQKLKQSAMGKRSDSGDKMLSYTERMANALGKIEGELTQ